MRLLPLLHEAAFSHTNLTTFTSFSLIIFPQTKRKRKTEDERKHKFFRVKFSLARLEMVKKSLEEIQLRLFFGGGSSRKVLRPKYCLLIENYFLSLSLGGFDAIFEENFSMLNSFKNSKNLRSFCQFKVEVVRALRWGSFFFKAGWDVYSIKKLCFMRKIVHSYFYENFYERYFSLQFL